MIHSGSSVKGNKKEKNGISDIKEKKKNPSSRIRTSDLRMTTSTLQSSALPTELSKEPRRFLWKIVYQFIQCVRLQEESWNNRQRNRHITNQNTSERNKNFFILLEILLFLTFSAIYGVFLFFRALKNIWFFSKVMFVFFDLFPFTLFINSFNSSVDIKRWTAEEKPQF